MMKNLGRFERSASDERIPSWAVQRVVSDLEETLWNRRDVTLFQESLDIFAARLAAELER